MQVSGDSLQRDLDAFLGLPILNAEVDSNTANELGPDICDPQTRRPCVSDSLIESYNSLGRLQLVGANKHKRLAEDQGSSNTQCNEVVPIGTLLPAVYDQCTRACMTIKC